MPSNAKIEAFEWYFSKAYPRGGRFDMPIIRRQPLALDDLGLIRFSSVVRDETEDLDATVHFFEPDERFDEVWKNPDAYLDELGQYRQVMSPDFSLFTTMPIAEQFLNTFRSRWCGWYWQEHGMTVIPTVSWSTVRSFEFCFDAIPKGSVVAVSTLGVRDVEEAFMAGFSHMCRRLSPDQVICYGQPFDAMLALVDVVTVPYARDARIAPREA
ncbi:MAG: DUF4417 domain-containing protein [Bifidobacteriaceae bacterium]|jgi:hypothetical protein|nr:DUF4417 domain-containing protein [Bifidobacteriaceae bacterium]